MSQILVHKKVLIPNRSWIVGDHKTLSIFVQGIGECNDSLSGSGLFVELFIFGPLSGPGFMIIVIFID